MKSINRRDFFRRSAAGLLAAGLWPGAAANAEGPDEAFRFVVINDTHYKDDKCGEYLEAAFSQMHRGPSFDIALVAGDISTAAAPRELRAFKQLTDAYLKVPTYCVLGNHDCPGRSRKAWVDTYGMDSINYRVDHKGWTFLGIDTTDGGKSSGVAVHGETIAWIRNALRDVPSKRPIVLFGHHPFGEGVHYRLVNAEEVLRLFVAHNLKHVFNGHFHGLTQKKSKGYGLTTNRCLSLSRGNHDGSKEKGYFLATVEGGALSYEFVQFEHRSTAGEGAGDDK